MSKEFNIHFISIKDKIFRFALKILNNHEDAQDAVQDVFEKLWKMRNNLNKYENLEAFTIKMTKNLCLDKLKQKKLKAQKMQAIESNQEFQIKNNNYDKKNTSEIIKLFINQLPDKQKMIIHLRDVEGFEFNEIAEIMEIDINAVRMNLSRGRKAIKEKLIKTLNYGL